MANLDLGRLSGGPLFGGFPTSNSESDCRYSTTTRSLLRAMSSLGTVTPRSSCLVREGGKAMALSVRQFLYLTRFNPHVSFSSTSPVSPMPNCHSHLSFSLRNRNRNQTVISLPVVKASAGNGSPTDDDDAVSLGTMVLPPDTDLQRFESLLFQWANSLCQGANLPLPVPLKVDKIPGGARLGFITVEDGKTEVPVHIDCLVFPATNNSAPMFRAIRNGLLKDKEAPGEPRIMRSLLQALKKSVEIARL